MNFGIIMALRKEQSGVKEFEQSCPFKPAAHALALFPSSNGQTGPVHC